LDADERGQVATMMAVDAEFAAIVQVWEFRLGVLNQMVGTIEPRPIVWENIRSELARKAFAQESPALPEASTSPLPPVPESFSPEPPSQDSSSLEEVPQPEPQRPRPDAIPHVVPIFI